jgi:NDP-4-keto-2,6-dideoxyhexose 3-C-methyltransferase
MNLTTHRHCRACRAILTEVLSLGPLALNAFPATPEEALAQVKVPHDLAVCRGCGLTQLMHTVPPDLMFRQYWYRSGINEAMRAELTAVATYAVSCLGKELVKGDWILDIGANDGTLLDVYRRLGGEEQCPWTRVAVEPARNFADELQRTSEIWINDYFPTDKLDGNRRRFKIITAIAMAYDLEEPLKFFAKIADLLHPSGVVIVQFQDLEQQIRTAAFDNIVAEHLEYYTLDSLCQIALQCGLYPMHCQQTPINGGSLRVTFKKGYVRTSDWGPAALEQLRKEDAAGLTLNRLRNTLAAFDRFAQRIVDTKRQILATLEAAAAYGSVTAYGASTKGNTLLQVLKLGPMDILCVADRSPAKHGRYTITGIPIVSEEAWRKLESPLALVPIWQFRDAVLQREANYLAKGGRFLFPLPHATIVAETWAPSPEEIGPPQDAGPYDTNLNEEV